MTQISFMTSAWKLLILRTGPKTSLISHCTFSRKFNYQVRFNSLFCSHCNLTISSSLTIPQGQRELENTLLRPCGTIIWKFIFLAIDLNHLKSDMYFSWYQTSILPRNWSTGSKAVSKRTPVRDLLLVIICIEILTNACIPVDFLILIVP